MNPAQPGPAQPGASTEPSNPAQPGASTELLNPAQPVAAQPVAAQPGAAQPGAIRIVSGRPGAEDVAALVAVLSALGSEPSAEAQPGPSAWSDPARRLSGPQPRSGGWRSSGLPR